MVDRDDAAAVPVAFLHRDLVAEFLLQLVARGRRQSAELDRGAVGADRLDAGRLLRRINALDRVEIRLARHVVIGVAHAVDRLPGLVSGELERAGPHDVLFVPVRVFFEDVLFVDPGERVGQRRQECRRRELQAEDDGLGIGIFDLLDHVEIGLAAGSACPPAGTRSSASFSRRRRRSAATRHGT